MLGRVHVPRLYLREDFRTALGTFNTKPCHRDVFDALSQLPGKVYRRTASRRTLRWEAGGRAYFVKLHDGVGWLEILKNLAALKVPIVSARPEFLACERLAEVGIRAPRVAGFGIRGRNPATLKSFIVCDALDDYVSLEAAAAHWRRQPPTLAWRRRLLREAALFTRKLHAAGVNHRDYYLSHLYVRKGQDGTGAVELAVIDLHRAGLRRRVPNRWLRRDLAALFFSCTDVWTDSGGDASVDLALTRRDWFRFVRDYTGERPAAAIRAQPRFWRTVLRRARRLARRGRRDTAALVS